MRIGAMARVSAKARLGSACKGSFVGAPVHARAIKRSNFTQRMSLRAMASSPYSVETVGDFPSVDFRMKFKLGDKVISPWHDIPLFNSDGTVNFICEIPKESMAKMEVATDEESTPIKQDMKKGKLRDYPYNINWNYGMLSQTWEDPGIKNPEVEDMAGDNDPLDVVEIGSGTCSMGSVVKCKVLGVYAMIDDGELDWKVICINVDDPLAADLNDVEDVEKAMPGELEKIRVWFRDYKMPDGKPENKFGMDDKCMPAAFAMDVIMETNGFYNALKSGKRENDEGLSLV